VDDLLGNRRIDDVPVTNSKLMKKNLPSNEDAVEASVSSNSLCQKLEQLSKKLNNIDDEIVSEDIPTASEPS
jgi:hypothetical protein